MPIRATCLTVLAICLLTAKSKSQSLHYDAFRKSKKVGNMDILVRTEENREIFVVKSNMEFRFLISLKVKFHNEEEFVDGILVKGNVKNEMIGFKESEAHIEKNDEGYDLTINGSGAPLAESEISYTVCKIYTQEPEDGQKLFSQYYGKYFVFEKIEDHKYRYSSPEGDNYYTYEYGICTEVKVERDFATIYFKLQPESLAAVKSGRSKFNHQ